MKTELLNFLLIRQKENGDFIFLAKTLRRKKNMNFLLLANVCLKYDYAICLFSLMIWQKTIFSI